MVVLDPHGDCQLVRGVDAAKDQSYVLYMLGQQELQRLRFPIGELTKVEVRGHASRLGLRTADKAESMDVCFITRGGRASFLAERVPARAGAIVDASGAVLGEHRGVAAFTIGQRRGLGVATGERRYVVDVDAHHATVTIGARTDLLRSSVELRDLRFVRAAPGGEPLLAQVRAHAEPVAAMLDRTTVHFARSQLRVAPGQVVALYEGPVLVGGGIAT